MRRDFGFLKNQFIIVIQRIHYHKAILIDNYLKYFDIFSGELNRFNEGYRRLNYLSAWFDEDISLIFLFPPK